MIFRRPFLLFLASATTAAVLRSVGVASSPVSEFHDPWMHRLNEAYRQGEDSCDFTLFLDVVEYYASGGEPHVQERVLDWLATFDQRLTIKDARLAYASVFSRVTDPRLLDRTKQLAGFLELRSAPLSVRRKIYLAAIASRLARMPNGAPINDDSALQEAAYDGVDEAAPSLERMTVTSGNPWKTEQLSLSAEVRLWYLRLRSGALNREGARRVHLSRLLAMPIQEFHWGMIGNPAFRIAAIGTIDDTCYRARSPQCGFAAALYDRWSAYLLQLPDSEDIEILPAGPGSEPARVGQVLAHVLRLINGVSR